MKKISEMTMNELTMCLSKMAEPASNLFRDAAVTEALKEMRDRAPEKCTIEMAFSLFTTIVVPVLTGEKHIQHTHAILAALDGVSAAEIGKRNGLETLKDMFLVFAIDKDVESIFRPCVQARP